MYGAGSVDQSSVDRKMAWTEIDGAVAQLGERLICTQEVIGSIPFSSTSISGGAINGPVAQLVEQTPDKGGVDSSSLSRPTINPQSDISRNQSVLWFVLVADGS